MLKSLITYLNLKLDLLNYFDLTRCLVELKEDSEGTKQPVEYISNGDYDVINWDEFNGVSYWRLRDEITSDRTEERKYKAGSRNNIETTVPLKLVFAVPRTKLTEDDAYSFDRIRQTMVKQFAIDDDVIKNTLQAESVRINVVTANSDAKDVWENETGGTGTFEPKYETVFGSIDVDVVIISKHSCLPTECDDVESDILRSFDWCGNTAVTVGRLTEGQQTCISDFLCACADATVQLNGSTIGTISSGESDSFPVLQDGSPVGSWNGSAWVVPDSTPCPSVSLAVSNTSPLRGETATLTATPSDITPTTYLFYAVSSDEEIRLIAQQASNTFDWEVNIQQATWMVYVEAVEAGSPNIHASDCVEITVQTAIVTDDLELYLDPFLSEISGTDYPDISGNSRDGTLINSPIVVVGSLDNDDGGYVDFDGVDQSVENIGAVADFSFIQNTLVFSVCGWFRLDDLSGTYRIAGNVGGSSDKGFLISVRTSGQIDIGTFKGVNGNSYTMDSNAGVISSETWYHFAFTCNGLGTGQIYINGSSVTTTITNTSYTLPSGNSSNELQLGRRATVGTEWLNGRIAPVQVYSKELSSAEVLQNFNADNERYGL